MHRELYLAQWVSIILIGLCLYRVAAAATMDDYLRKLDGDLKQQALTLTTSQHPIQLPTVAAEYAARLPLGLSPEQFEATLRNSFPGTFAFYERRRPAAKRTLFNIYQQDNRVSAINEQAIKLLSEGKH